jgi:hypothetical protein
MLVVPQQLSILRIQRDSGVTVEIRWSRKANCIGIAAMAIGSCIGYRIGNTPVDDFFNWIVAAC